MDVLTSHGSHKGTAAKGGRRSYLLSDPASGSGLGGFYQPRAMVAQVWEMPTDALCPAFSVG